MKKLLQKLIKYLAYLGAALVIMLAVAVGIFRLMLPRLPEYQDEIKAWASAAIGIQVEFSAMNARWRLSGPELNFFDAEKIAAAGLGPIDIEIVLVNTDKGCHVLVFFIENCNPIPTRDHTGAYNTGNTA